MDNQGGKGYMNNGRRWITKEESECIRINPNSPKSL